MSDDEVTGTPVHESEDLLDSGLDLFADEDEEAEDFEPKREEPDVDDDAWLYECSVTAD